MESKPRRGGIWPAQMLRAAIGADGAIRADQAVGESQVQPASLDLRLGPTAYRVRASFLPGPGRTVAEKIDAFSMHTIDLADGAVLERNCVYIVPLLERLALPAHAAAIANPKSTTGRLDLFARVITDHGTQFDLIRPGYDGPLYAEISPRTFSVLVRTGSRLVQLRIRDGEAEPEGLSSLPFTVDLSGLGPEGIVGYKARRHAPLIDFEAVGAYPPLDFWEPVRASRDGLILNPDDFYILASKEAVTVPADQAAEMQAYDTLMGEFRVHYAGFFDPGFGADETGGAGSRAVLEVRSHDVPFFLADGQLVGRLVYEPLLARPDKLYGAPIGSTYQRQGLQLGKQFRPL